MLISYNSAVFVPRGDRRGSSRGGGQTRLPSGARFGSASEGGLYTMVLMGPLIWGPSRTSGSGRDQRDTALPCSLTSLFCPIIFSSKIKNFWGSDFSDFFQVRGLRFFRFRAQLFPRVFSHLIHSRCPVFSYPLSGGSVQSFSAEKSRIFGGPIFQTFFRSAAYVFFGLGLN
ncbi:hypothetical protein JZ751_023290 [Albula glossodonta]|uniref:Uncharacterized protein n=1 Tax=Albula glossodonta TaxID=121402 RepID=A0A8T2NI06_9TELE|nr:hypothetical protein JZ751_023290 [Albula glossodonta]